MTLLPDRVRVLAIISILAAGPALAQPTGNPKGTTPPSTQGTAAKTPAERGGRPAQSEATPDVAGARTNPDSKAARSGQLRTPGIGTAGGLSGRHPGDGTANRTTETNQAPSPGQK